MRPPLLFVASRAAARAPCTQAPDLSSLAAQLCTDVRTADGCGRYRCRPSNLHMSRQSLCKTARFADHALWLSTPEGLHALWAALLSCMCPICRPERSEAQGIAQCGCCMPWQLHFSNKQQHDTIQDRLSAACGHLDKICCQPSRFAELEPVVHSCTVLLYWSARQARPAATQAGLL